MEEICTYVYRALTYFWYMVPMHFLALYALYDLGNKVVKYFDNKKIKKGGSCE